MNKTPDPNIATPECGNWLRGISQYFGNLINPPLGMCSHCGESCEPDTNSHFECAGHAGM
jgi:hypothetical protein